MVIFDSCLGFQLETKTSICGENSLASADLQSVLHLQIKLSPSLNNCSFLLNQPTKTHRCIH